MSRWILTGVVLVTVIAGEFGFRSDNVGAQQEPAGSTAPDHVVALGREEPVLVSLGAWNTAAPARWRLALSSRARHARDTTASTKLPA